MSFENESASCVRVCNFVGFLFRGGAHHPAAQRYDGRERPTRVGEKIPLGPSVVTATSGQRHVADDSTCYYEVTVDTYPDGHQEVQGDPVFLGCSSSPPAGVGGGDGGGGSDTLDCSQNADNSICQQLAYIPATAGQGCRGSDQFGGTLGAQLPLSSQDPKDYINNILYVYEPVIGGGSTIVVWVYTTASGNEFIQENGVDSNWLTNLANQVPILAQALATIKGTYAGAFSAPLSTEQYKAFFNAYPLAGKGQGTNGCFSSNYTNA